MKPNYDVMAIADLCIDILVSGPSKPEFGQVELLAGDYTMSLGGSVGIFASQVAKLGGKVALIGTTGDDAAGKIIMEELLNAGVDTSFVAILPDRKTAMGLNISVNGDRAMLAYLGSMDFIGQYELQEIYTRLSSHWHIGSFFLLHNLIPSWREWIRKLKKQGVTVSLDTNWSPSGKWYDVIELLPEVDVFLPNDAEALAISGETDIISAGKKLSMICQLVVIKCGAQGSMVFVKGVCDSYPIASALLTNLIIKDTTGAGDNFDAGFIYYWMKGFDIKTCIEEATHCAVSSLQSLGGIAGQVMQSNKNLAPVL
ncbi:MAG: carbohydrate kinase family protein [Chitinophagaceae bacterium]|nr:carbohydrate kinase family protein [Chitinophagaceae bacterium]